MFLRHAFLCVCSGSSVVKNHGFEMTRFAWSPDEGRRPSDSKLRPQWGRIWFSPRGKRLLTVQMHHSGLSSLLALSALGNHAIKFFLFSPKWMKSFLKNERQMLWLSELGRIKQGTKKINYSKYLFITAWFQWQIFVVSLKVYIEN